ncbi:MAG TPA: hypothetical protein DD437_16720, partial [Rhodobiaceae bacterium]|nr:hypothetical protein [Rhodobiaceae bacterium]
AAFFLAGDFFFAEAFFLAATFFFAGAFFFTAFFAAFLAAFFFAAGFFFVAFLAGAFFFAGFLAMGSALLEKMWCCAKWRARANRRADYSQKHIRRLWPEGGNMTDNEQKYVSPCQFGLGWFLGS